tara:strand:- start:180 stop:374 length:195 start_codon:yes stop_codon:yes gene_type:complete
MEELQILPSYQLSIMALTIKQIHDEITKNMVISYPRNIEEETAKRAVEFKRIFKREYGTEWKSY